MLYGGVAAAAILSTGCSGEQRGLLKEAADITAEKVSQVPGNLAGKFRGESSETIDLEERTKELLPKLARNIREYTASSANPLGWDPHIRGTRIAVDPEDEFFTSTEDLKIAFVPADEIVKYGVELPFERQGVNVTHYRPGTRDELREAKDVLSDFAAGLYDPTTSTVLVSYDETPYGKPLSELEDDVFARLLGHELFHHAQARAFPSYVKEQRRLTREVTGPLLWVEGEKGEDLSGADRAVALAALLEADATLFEQHLEREFPEQEELGLIRSISIGLQYRRLFSDHPELEQKARQYTVGAHRLLLRTGMDRDEVNGLYRSPDRAADMMSGL